jgi:hypothetical protein
MPKYKNSLRAPEFDETVFVTEDEDGRKTVIGHLRVKPSSIMWKPTGARKYHRVSLQKFIDWITDEETGASLKSQ